MRLFRLRNTASLALLLFTAPIPGAAPLLAQSGPAITAGTIVLRDLSLGDPGISGSVGLIEFSGMSRAGDRVTARSVKVEKLLISGEIFEVEMPSLVASNFSAPAAAVDAVMAGRAASVDWLAFLAAATIARIDVPAISYELRSGERRQTVNTSGIVFDNLSGGMLESLTLGSQDSTMTGPSPADNGSVRGGLSRYEAINVGELSRLMVGGGSGPAKVLVQSGTSQGVTWQSGASSGRVGTSAATGLMGRAPSAALAYGDLVRLTEDGATDDPQLRRRLAAWLRDLVTYSSMQTSTASDMQFDSGGAPVSVGGARFDGVGLGAFSLFEFTDLSGTTPLGAFRLGRFAIEKADWSALLMRMIDTLETGSDIGAPALDSLPKLGAVRFQDFAATSEQGPVSFGEVALETSGGAAIPESVTLAAKRVTAQLGEGPPADWKERLQALGYNAIVADARLALRYDPASKVLALQQSGISIDDAGSVQVTVRLAGFDPEELLEAGMSAPRHAADITLAGIDIDLTDAGLAQRFYDSVARDAGVSSDAIREGIAAEFRSQANMVFGGALTQGSDRAVADFLRDPGKLSIRVTPRSDAPPLTLADITAEEPPLFSDRVTISIEATGK